MEWYGTNEPLHSGQLNERKEQYFNSRKSVAAVESTIEIYILINISHAYALRHSTFFQWSKNKSLGTFTFVTL